MKSFLSKSILGLLVLGGSAASAAAKLGYVPGEVLVRYKKAMSISAVSDRLQQDGLVYLNKLKKPKSQKNNQVIRARLSKNESVTQAVKRLSQNENVESVQPNFKYKTLAGTFPNDTHFAKQWALQNTAQNVIDYSIAGPSFPSAEGIPAISGKDMNLTIAWDTVKNCDQVTVAVIDSGIKYDHEDLAANMWDDPTMTVPNHGYDTFNGDNDPMDDNGHGTHVAGTIGAVGNNAKGTTGVCWTVKLMAIKAMDAAGAGTTATITEAIDWAFDNNANVINLSLGGDNADPLLLAAIQNVKAKEIVVVSAAGNDGTNNSTTAKYPCNYRDTNTICVAATGQDNRLGSFSNFSTTYVDVGAPGINIISPWPLTRQTTHVDLDITTWTAASATGSVWGSQIVNFSTPQESLTVPAPWDNSTPYLIDSDTKVHQEFDFSNGKKIWLQRAMLSNLNSGDLVKTVAKGSLGSPFASGTVIETVTNADNTGSSSYFDIFDISATCAESDCAVGFQFTSNHETVHSGVVIHSMDLISFETGTAGYNMIRGTSMATPHVAGLAALLRTRNPDYKAADIVNSIKNGGTNNTFLAAKTTSGKSVSATGSLAYILAPTGVTAVQAP